MNRNLFIIVFFLACSLSDLSMKAQQMPAYVINRLDFNSPAYNDISPVMFKDGLVFCSDRRFSGVKDRTAYDGRRLYNIYFVERKDTSGHWGKPAEIKSERSTLFNNGPLCIAPDGKTIYFTSEIETGTPTKKKNFKNKSGIFVAQLSGLNISAVTPFKYNNPGYSIGNPAISKDGKQLFFASDMPGGQGGSDIYMCQNVNGEWGEPVNLGPLVNSDRVDNFPFIHPSGRLYFSSDRKGGPGGLDVYYTYIDNGEWMEPVLLPEPVNSPSDDFAFIAEETLQKGYFASNRRRSDDIYEFKYSIIRKTSCNPLEENIYCYEFIEENAIKYDTIPFRYEWKFGDGSKGVGPVVEHCYSGPGTYLVQLDVVNLITGETMVNEKSELLEVKDIEQPYISAPDTVLLGTPVKFSAGLTNLPGWNIAMYYWNFDDETVAVGKEVEKVYKTPGNYNIQLIVTTAPDSEGKIKDACVSRNIFIRERP